MPDRDAHNDIGGRFTKNAFSRCAADFPYVAGFLACLALTVVDRLAACELLDVTVEGPVLFLYIEEVLGVDDCGGHLRTVADDASIGKEARVISGGIPGDTPGVEIVESPVRQT